MDMKRGKSKNNPRHQRSRLVFCEMKSEKIRPEPGEDERREKKDVVAGDPAENQLEIGIESSDIELRPLDKLERSFEKSLVGNQISLVPRHTDHLHRI